MAGKFFLVDFVAVAVLREQSILGLDRYRIGERQHFAHRKGCLQRLMDIVLAGAKWSACLVYLDDIVIVGMTFHQHLANTWDVLDKLRQAGLHLKPGNVLFSWTRSITWDILYLRERWLRIM